MKNFLHLCETGKRRSRKWGKAKGRGREKIFFRGGRRRKEEKGIKLNRKSRKRKMSQKSQRNRMEKESTGH